MAVINALNELLNGTITSEEYVNNIDYANIAYNNDSYFLPSVRTKETEERFINFLKNINYDTSVDNDYLFGVICFKDDACIHRINNKWEYYINYTERILADTNYNDFLDYYLNN